MAGTFNDMKNLSGDPTFQGRVQAGLIVYCGTVNTEAWTVPFHRERQTFVSQVANNPTAYTPMFAITVAGNGTVINDATQGGTVAITTGNAATQQALVTDTDISNAIASQFNAFFRTPGV